MNTVIELINNAPACPMLFSFADTFGIWIACTGLVLVFICTPLMINTQYAASFQIFGLILTVLGLAMGGSVADDQKNITLHDSEFEDAIKNECSNNVVIVDGCIASMDNAYTIYTVSVGHLDRTLFVRVTNQKKNKEDPIVVAARGEKTTACLSEDVRKACVEAVYRYELYNSK